MTYLAVAGVEGLYILDPDDPGELEVVGELFFAEPELEEEQE